MAVLKFSVEDSVAKKLADIAAADGLSLPDYLRSKVLGETPLFTPAEIIRRCRAACPLGGEFTLPDLYTAQEWRLLSKGQSGVIGRVFYNYIENNKAGGEISFWGIGKKTRRATYKYTPTQEDSPGERADTY